MKNKIRRRIALVFGSGVVLGLCLAWAMQVFVQRGGDAPGGEMFLPLLAGLMMGLGFTIRDFYDAVKGGK